MEALLQRVSRSSVSVDGQAVGQIGPGILVFVGVVAADTEEDAKYLAAKIIELRIFADHEGKFNLSVADIQGEILVVSQFTLLADTRKGRRPSFSRAASPEIAESLIQSLTQFLTSAGLKVETGQFQAYMQVEIHNDGPVTIPLDSSDRHKSRRHS